MSMKIRLGLGMPVGERAGRMVEGIPALRDHAIRQEARTDAPRAV